MSYNLGPLAALLKHVIQIAWAPSVVLKSHINRQCDATNYEKEKQSMTSMGVGRGFAASISL